MASARTTKASLNPGFLAFMVIFAVVTNLVAARDESDFYQCVPGMESAGGKIL